MSDRSSEIIMFKEWHIESLSFDAVKKQVNFTAFRSNFAESYSFRKEIDFIYGIEEFLTNLNKLCGDYNSNNNSDDIKKFLTKYNFLMVM